ncbi:N-acetylglucosaminyl-phosphatidylinositol de-N-acetylase [Tribolium madens]|uniref:N-acetylglucosaminyl-phosphatidylinositol de-N-acetylase n=1 Tax=Tribolium madens TaxID=41895 RepID=UPI001CF74DDB|nr:N-acetylglucosaminyl-phosphatidylinositol de-N-acetylase [Tribolium madens]XP_044260296.1 N-acetylglucosaminyl-phosphatidylinositol de-N-acetylase [Tribolium madens]XP_044260297.1 N-acetylglucosaminyl-phosphatidylinositol de-N-acetylase [Tribolium madens]
MSLGFESLVSLVSTSWKNLSVRVQEYTKETVEHLIVFVSVYIIVCVFLYLSICRWKLIDFKKDVKNPHRVLLVIAHPDDECMFFGPTVLNFTKQNQCKVFLMCLSTGQKVRKQELYKSCRMLGIDDSCITVCNHTNLPDRMGAKWPIELVAKLILNHVESHNIDTLVTFDKHGVSYHLNHCSIYYAIAHLSIEKKLPKECSVYVLETVNLLRKYWLLLDIPVSFLLSRIRYLVTSTDRALIHKAMKQHQSQLVWFRRLYMLFSRYMLINSLQLMELSDIELDLEIDD